MPNLWASLRTEKRYTIDDWAKDKWFTFNGQQYPIVGLGPMGQRQEDIENSFAGYVQSAYKANGVVFACVLVRMLVFAEARFQWQRMRGGRPGDLFGTPELSILERPWPNGTTGELLSRAEQDSSLGGNFYVVREGRRLRRLRPDWVSILLTAPPGEAVESDVAGYRYKPGGSMSRAEPVVYTPEQVAHWSPIPDPEAQYRGMSWVTAVVREVMGDKAATGHKLKFFENAATPNLAVSFKETVSHEEFGRFMEAMNQAHQGGDNAYKTLYLGGGADVTVVGKDLQQLDFKVTQGAGEPLAVDTPVPTPTGWTAMGDIAPGSLVLGRDGLPALVLGVSPVHLGRECYRVTFNDRTSIVADASHVWTVMDRNSHRREVQHTTEQLRDLIDEWSARGKEQANRFGIPAAAPIKGAPRDLLVDPYVLGVWLGDGHTAGAAITGAREDLAEIAREIEQRGYTVTHWQTTRDKAGVIGLPGGLLSALRALGVLGKKHIPAEYLRASIEQRLDLLRGLMDTDGTVGRIGRESCEYSSKFEHLARQVAELIRSLGNRATVTCKSDRRSRTGETWRVGFRADPETVPFLMKRKAQRCVSPLHVRNRAITSVEPVGSVPVRCIAVDTADHLFLAGDGFHVTHNTRIAAASGVGAVVAQLSEGMQGSSLNAGNYAAARRRAADALFRPLWRSACAALEPLLSVPDNTRLWYDDRDIAFLREDAKDASEIEQIKAATIRQYVDSGFKWDSAVAAVDAGDITLLDHTGLFSVQLQPPGADTPAPDA